MSERSRKRKVLNVFFQDAPKERHTNEPPPSAPLPPTTPGIADDIHPLLVNMQTHERQKTSRFPTFTSFLACDPPLVESQSHDLVYGMVDYCNEARRSMESLIRDLESIPVTVDAPAAQLNMGERYLLRLRRSQWSEHLRTHFYSLIHPPPSAGGATARYSPALQLWLLVCHANVILEQSDAVADLYTYNAAEVPYLSRNELIVDNAPVMEYPLLTAITALMCMVSKLDTIDHLDDAYLAYANVLEHRLSDLICHRGTREEYNAPQWCVAAGEGETQMERVSDEFLLYSMCWITTIYLCADNWLQVHTVAVRDEETKTTRSYCVRVPAHEVAYADWAPSGRSQRRLTAFLCQYTFGMKAAIYAKTLRTFLLQFELRPYEVDLYRVLMKTNRTYTRTVLQFEFRGMSAVARAFVQKVFFNRPPYEYISDKLQWQSGDLANTRSASVGRQGLYRELAVIFAFSQYFDGKFGFSFRERFMLFDRDPRFVVRLTEACSDTRPIIIKQFNRWTVFVPHKRNPMLDVEAMLYQRALTRVYRKKLAPLMTQPPPPSPLQALGAPVSAEMIRFVRAYDCTDTIQALCVWAAWFLLLCQGRVDMDISIRDTLEDLFGWKTTDR